MVTVDVSLDDQRQSFLVRKNFTCHYSPFFDAPFNGNFVEGENQGLDLEDTNPMVFAIFVNWLGCIPKRFATQ